MRVSIILLLLVGSVLLLATEAQKLVSTPCGKTGMWDTCLLVSYMYIHSFIAKIKWLYKYIRVHVLLKHSMSCKNVILLKFTVN